MSDSLRAESESSSALRWSLYAGGYAFGCAALTAFLLSDLLGLFAEVIGLPPVAGMPLLATPALVVGAVVWWALVERRDAPTYLRGAAFGLLTALFVGAAPAAAVFIVGWFLLTPVLFVFAEEIGSLLPDRGTDDESADQSADQSADPLEQLKTRYARGEIDEAEFERRTALLLENQSIDDVQSRVDREQSHATGTTEERAELRRDREREFET